MCRNREYIPGLYTCDGTVNCVDKSDELNCPGICIFKGRVHMNLTFCSNVCSPKDCLCSRIYFQCRFGGCIPESKMCDQHADCHYAEDESFCQNMTFSTLPTQLFMVTGDKGNNACADPNWISCEATSEGTCYPRYLTCIYERDINNLPKYCTNGKHLQFCKHIQCSQRFKCPSSYCTPIHTVCDGVWD